MPIILAVTLLQKSKNYTSICIISKLAKDKVSSEAKGLTENRHYSPVAIIKHTLLKALLSFSKRKRYKTLGEPFRQIHNDLYSVIYAINKKLLWRNTVFD